MKLTPTMEKYILHWGEMGTRWGINRTVAQIHALLYISPKPLPAEEIATTLAVARSNVSTSLRELQGWGIVRSVHILGDRRDHFETMTDVWEMFRIIVDERKKRELDPTIRVLRECVAEAEKSGASEKFVCERLATMLQFVETTTAAYSDLQRLPVGTVRKLIATRSKFRKLFGIGRE